MRDVIGRMRDIRGGGYAGRMICGTDHLPEITPGRAAVFGAAPPNPRRAENENGNNQRSKKECLFFI